MQSGDLLKLSALGNDFFSQAKVTEISPVNSESYVRKPNVSDASSSSVYIIPLTFFTLWLIYLLLSTDILKFAKHKILMMKHSEEVPCKSCRYFTNNPYLRCAVNPSVALTSQAVNCSEYCPLNKENDD